MYTHVAGALVPRSRGRKRGFFLDLTLVLLLFLADRYASSSQDPVRPERPTTLASLTKGGGPACCGISSLAHICPIPIVIVDWKPCSRGQLFHIRLVDRVLEAV